MALYYLMNRSKFLIKAFEAPLYLFNFSYQILLLFCSTQGGFSLGTIHYPHCHLPILTPAVSSACNGLPRSISTCRCPVLLYSRSVGHCSITHVYILQQTSSSLPLNLPAPFPASMAYSVSFIFYLFFHSSVFCFCFQLRPFISKLVSASL